MQRFIDSLTFPLEVIKNPMESLTQLVATVINWIGPKHQSDEIINCLLDSEGSIDPIITRSPHIPIHEETLDDDENNLADKVMTEIHSSLIKRRHTFLSQDTSDDEAISNEDNTTILTEE